MSRAAQSLYVASLYLIALGLGLVLVPNLVLGSFGLPTTDEVWVRMLGMMTFFFGVVQSQIAREELPKFFRLSVVLRVSVVGFVVAFVLAGLAQPPFLLIAGVDVLGAGWTAWALKHPKTSTVVR
ncbi:MAG: hypothetical protein MUC99_13050 [Anaerolineae bacterium]|nr:hypothetical protein [Anaerolineae bacterium]